MENADIQTIMDKLGDLWPKWEPPVYEREIWVKAFRPLKYSETLAAIEWIFANKRRLNNPDMSQIIGRAKGYGAAGTGTREGNEPACGYYIRCIKHYIPAMVGREFMPYEAYKRDLLVERGLLADRGNLIARKLEEIYKGQWIVVIPEPEEVVEHDFTGTLEQRRKQAEENILAGPDCPGKRFVQAIRAGKRPELLKTLPARVNDGQRKAEQLAALAAVPTATTDDIPF